MPMDMAAEVKRLGIWKADFVTGRERMR